MKLVALAALALLLTACEDAGGDAATGAPAWSRAADSPLSARYGPLLAWTGEEVLAFGGHTGPPCPPNADCTVLDDLAPDGAAYDPDTDSWRPLADPPVGVDRYTGHVMAHGELVVGDQRAWWTYDPGADTWRRIPDPPARVGPPEAARGRLAYTHWGSRVYAVDPTQGEWTALPPNPLTPRLRDGNLFATDDAGVVLTGVDYAGTAPDEPTLTQVDVLPGDTWQRLPATGMIGPLYHWTGDRLVGLEIGGADGGEVNGWDHWYPFAGALDPATGEWSEIPGIPGLEDLSDGNWRVEAAAGPLVATSGFAYDDDSGVWTPLGRPDSELDRELTAVWAGDRLVVVGGADEDGDLLSETWILRD